MGKNLALNKGESITFLDYTIKNSINDDGLVLSKKKGRPYETHLGNFGVGTQDKIDACKRYAIVHFMVARPDEFASTIVNKVMRLNGGTMSEYFKLKHVCENEGIELPDEITCGDGINCMIYFQDKPLAHKSERD